MQEVWKPIPGYEGLYEISNIGSLKSYAPHPRYKPGRIIKSVMDDKGYIQYSLCKAGVKRLYKIHQLVMLAFVGPQQKGIYVNHKNGIRHDNRLENLEYVTPSENIKHAYDCLAMLKNRPRGIGSHHCAKFTNEEVRDIRIRRNRGESWESITKHFNRCSMQAIRAIGIRRTYKYVT